MFISPLCDRGACRPTQPNPTRPTLDLLRELVSRSLSVRCACRPPDPGPGPGPGPPGPPASPPCLAFPVTLPLSWTTSRLRRSPHPAPLHSPSRNDTDASWPCPGSPFGWLVPPSRSSLPLTPHPLSLDSTSRPLPRGRVRRRPSSPWARPQPDNQSAARPSLLRPRGTQPRQRSPLCPTSPSDGDEASKKRRSAGTEWLARE